MNTQAILVISGFAFLGIAILGSGNFVKIVIPPMRPWARVSFGAVGAVALILAFSVAAASSSSSGRPNASPTHQAASTPPTARPVTPNTTASPKQVTASLQFVNLHKDQKVGASISPLEITGTMPSGERAWVVVESSNEYYVQGYLSLSQPSSNLWTLGTVSFGSVAGPVGVPYDVYVILADSHASSGIQRAYKETDNGNNGIPNMPRGAGVKDSCEVTVFRTH
jgi:hypothetical protein